MGYIYIYIIYIYTFFEPRSDAVEPWAVVPVLAELPETTEVSPASEPLHVPFPPAPIRARMLSAQSSSSRVVARFTSTCAAPSFAYSSTKELSIPYTDAGGM